MKTDMSTEEFIERQNISYKLELLRAFREQYRQYLKTYESFFRYQKEKLDYNQSLAMQSNLFKDYQNYIEMEVSFSTIQNSVERNIDNLIQLDKAIQRMDLEIEKLTMQINTMSNLSDWR